jgi:hypothetical protein
MIFIFIVLVYSCVNVQKSKHLSSEVPELGVNIHFTGNPIDVTIIKESGLKVVRMDLSWSKIEKQKGIYDFQSTGYDKLTDSLIKNGLRPYYILDYNNGLYGSNKSITTKEELNAFINFVAKATSRYKNKHIIWEIWNEPNGGLWEPKPNYDDYSNLVKSVSKIIKKNDPTGLVVAPALSSSNQNSLAWLSEIFKRNILNYIDAVSIHPYRGSPPETVTNDYYLIRNLIAKYTQRKIPIVSGEWGYPTGNVLYGYNIDENKQAQYAVRMFLINMYEKIPISIWYDWKNDGSDPNNPEQNFGLRENDVTTPKLAFYSVKTLNRIISGYNFYKRIDLDNKNDYVLLFKNNSGHQIVICWTTDPSHKIKLPNYIYGSLLSMYGEHIGTIERNKPIITVSTSPTYILKS